MPMHSLHAKFLVFLPCIEACAKLAFRDIRCPAEHADRVAETLALAWKWFVRLEARGKDIRPFVSIFAGLAARAVRSGRKVAGMEKAKDIMNRRTQARRGFVVVKLPEYSLQVGNALTDALVDSTATPPPDAAAFRMDFPRWLGSLKRRDRSLAAQLMLGERPTKVAKRLDVSNARVSQLRRELAQDWSRFHGELAAASQECAADAALA